MTWTCQCGRSITAQIESGEVVECSDCGHQYSFAQLTALPEEERAKAIRSYDALYIDGYANLPAYSAVIFLFATYAKVFIGDTNSNVRLMFQYDSVRSVNVLQEREITALRTFLIGPVFAAWFKKKTRILTIGFRDELGMVQTPSFKMTDDDVANCYSMIMEQMKRAKKA